MHASLHDRAVAGDAAAQVSLAAALDAGGDHAAAIDWLARAAGANDPTALRLLGIRLSTGRNAPGLPAEGAVLIRQAGDLGDPQALALLAVFAGIGYLEPRDWALAHCRLHAAAAAGPPGAREEFDLLAAGPDGDGVNTPLTAWLAPAAGVIVRDSPRIVRFDGLIPGAACERLIASNHDRLVRAKVFDPLSGTPIVESTRTNRIASATLFETDLLTIVVQARLAAAAGLAVETLEAPAILNYRPGEQAHPHFDFIDPAAPGFATEMRLRGQRVATILLYLNDDYDDGETAFPELGLRHRGRRGDALLFHSVDARGMPDRRTVHAGLPPENGLKWVLSQFVRSRPPGEILP